MRRAPIIRETSRWIERAPLRLDGVHLRVFERQASDGLALRVIVGREPIGRNGEPRWHLSIATDWSVHETPAPRYPSWDEIADARERFLPDELTFAMILPPRAEYVNLHQTTFHLHELDA